MRTTLYEKVSPYLIVSGDTSALNETYRWACISVIVFLSLRKFQQNTNDMHVMKFHLFHFEENEKLKNVNAKFKCMVKSKFTVLQYLTIF